MAQFSGVTSNRGYRTLWTPLPENGWLQVVDALHRILPGPLKHTAGGFQSRRNAGLLVKCDFGCSLTIKVGDEKFYTIRFHELEVLAILGSLQNRLTVLPSQSSYLEETEAENVLLIWGQGTFFNLCNLFHIVYRPDNTDWYLKIPFDESV